MIQVGDIYDVDMKVAKTSQRKMLCKYWEGSYYIKIKVAKSSIVLYDYYSSDGRKKTEGILCPLFFDECVEEKLFIPRVGCSYSITGEEA
jgi:hypothetical protein